MRRKKGDVRLRLGKFLNNLFEQKIKELEAGLDEEDFYIHM